MGYADGYYYGQGKIIVNTLTDETVKVIGESNTYTKASDSGKAIFTSIPCGESYTVEIYENNVLQDNYTADLGYGDVIEITQEVKPITVTVYSAACDTVYYIDGSKTISFCTTDSAGKAEDITVTPGTTITLYSTVAKDTSDVTSVYSKTFTIKSNTTELYMMPEGAIYWYGYAIDTWKYPVKYVSSSSWTLSGSFTIATNYVQIVCGTSSYQTYGARLTNDVDLTNYSTCNIRTSNLGDKTIDVSSVTSDEFRLYSMSSACDYVGFANAGSVSTDYGTYNKTQLIAAWLE